MARDPLPVLLTIRRRVADAHRQVLAACLDTEKVIAGAIAALEVAFSQEIAATDSDTELLRFRDMFGARRDALTARLLTARSDLAAAEGRTEEARAGLAASRLAVEAVERLIAEADDRSRAETLRREQHDLDDIARGLRQ